MNQDNTAIENQEEKQETFWSTMKYLFVQVPKELLGIGYPKSSPPPNEEIKRKCLGAVAGMVCTEAEIKETENTDDDSTQEVPKETFWSTMKFLFVQVTKELLNIGYPKSSPPPNEEIKRKCLGAVAGMVCTEIKKGEKLRGCESRCTKRPYYRQTTLSGSAKCQRKKHKISAW